METEIKPWIQNITAEDMPNEDLRFIAEKAGLNAALALLFYAPGLIVSIPKNGFRLLKDKYILKNYRWNKYSLNELAVKCDVTPRYIYKLVKNKTHLQNTNS